MAKQPDITKVIANLKKKPRKVHDAVVKTLAIEGKRVLVEMTLLTPVDTGMLRMGNRAEVRETLTGVSLSFRNKEPYATYVEFGTGPIGEASIKKFIPEGMNLTYRDIGWVYSKDGLFRFTNGQPARPFFYPPIINNRSRISKKVLDAVKEALSNDQP